MITFTHTGDFKKTEKFLKNAANTDIRSVLTLYGQLGVSILSDATPKDTGKTASSWSYDIQKTKNSYTLSWSNSNVVDGANIAILIQYGHGTRNGGYVQGRDYINPAIQPLFDDLADKIWKEVTNA